MKLELDDDDAKIYRSLLKALEGARTKLAIAIAEETKTTPLQRWHYYLETSDLMRRCLKRMRAHPHSASNRSDWLEALDALREVPPGQSAGSRGGEADLLCRHVRTVLGRLGQDEK